VGEEGLRRGQGRWAPNVRSALRDGKPRDLTLNVAL
jgi:hypothetical protein